MKKCTKCGKEKPLNEFYTCKGNKDGRMGSCKECKLKYQQERPAEAIQKIEHKRNQKQQRKEFLYKNLCRWRTENPEKARAQRILYKKKYIARNILNAALRDGKIQRQPCENCSEIKTEAHHEDYSKPLEVTWLCKKCHIAIHKEAGVPF